MILGMSTDKLKQTRQRELVLSLLKDNYSHPSADWIYEEARKKIPDISKGTVYRNLAVLTEKGKITELELGGSVTRYEPRQPFHYHFKCDRCGKVADINLPVARKLNHDAALATGFKITGHQLEFHGLCLGCQQIS
jgi:Fur family transcriptional regulator, peroxide stress response regulator